MPRAFTDEDQKYTDTIVHEVLTSTGTPGAIIGVWLPDRGEYVQTYGVSDRDKGTPPNVNDHFRIASITKTFVATVLLQLVDEGKIALSTPISEFKFDLSRSGAATLADLLGMVSGIYDYTQDEAFVAAYEADPLMPFTPEEAFAIARRHDPLFAAGKGMRYCDTNFIVAGRIAEELTGRTLKQLLEERILDPYELRATSFPTDPEIPAPVLRGYTKMEKSESIRDVTLSNPDIAWAAGAMISNLQDLRTWSALLAGGKLLSPETQKARLQMHRLTKGEPVRYGLGIAQLHGFLGHNGGIAGYSTMMLHDPDVDATIVTATNLSDPDTGGATTIVTNLLQHFFPERVAASL